MTHSNSSKTTLVSLALLKVQIDRGNDYLDYLMPFILNILSSVNGAIITDELVRDRISTDFGLEVPARTVQVLLRRLSKKGMLRKQSGSYTVSADLTPSDLESEKASALRHIDAVVSGLLGFEKEDNPLASDDQALSALRSFFGQFTVSCLDAFLRGSTIPDYFDDDHRDVVFVSRFVVWLQKNEPKLFESFMVMVQGHMFANALTCPDLATAGGNYKGLTFYLDAPLALDIIGLGSNAEADASEQLLSMLKRLKGEVAMLKHSIGELQAILRTAASSVDSLKPLNQAAFVARDRGLTKSDLLLICENVENDLVSKGVTVRDNPRHIARYQIDEKELEAALGQNLNYRSNDALLNDVDSVRAIYTFRGGYSPAKLEDARAVLVTKNHDFARVAWLFGKEMQSAERVSTTITDFSLANLAWLKSPMDSPGVPEREVLAYSYAALRPSQELLDKYLDEIQKLEQNGTFTSRDLMILRSNPVAETELMNLTLGSEVALTKENILELRDRVIAEVKGEEAEKLVVEQSAHEATLRELAHHLEFRRKNAINIQTKCSRLARLLSNAVALTLGGIMFVGAIIGIITGLGGSVVGGFFGVILTVSCIFSFFGAVWGTTVKILKSKLESRLYNSLLHRRLDQDSLSLVSENNRGDK